MMASQNGYPTLRFAAGAVLLLSLCVSTAGRPAAAAKSTKPAAKAPTSFEMPKIRLVAVSVPVATATVRAAKEPVTLGTVSYLLGDFRTTFDIMVSPMRDGGVVWMARKQGQARVQEQGTIPGAKLKDAAGGHFCVIADKVGTKPTGIVASGKRFFLFHRFSPDYRAMLVACPKPVPAKPVRTALFIKGMDPAPLSVEPKGSMGVGSSGKPVPWQLGAKAYQSAMSARQRLKKPVALYFSQKNSKECKQVDGELLSACRVQEILNPAVKVRIDPTASAAEKAIASRYGVTSTPTFLVLPAGSDEAKWVLPEKKGGKFDASMPCHFHDTLAAALGKKS